MSVLLGSYLCFYLIWLCQMRHDINLTSPLKIRLTAVPILSIPRCLIPTETERLYILPTQFAVALQPQSNHPAAGTEPRSTFPLIHLFLKTLTLLPSSPLSPFLCPLSSTTQWWKGIWSFSTKTDSIHRLFRKPDARHSIGPSIWPLQSGWREGEIKEGCL